MQKLTIPLTITEKTKVLLYDWLKLVAITKYNYSDIVEILLYFYGIKKEVNSRVLFLAAKYANAEDKHRVNFLVEGRKVLTLLHSFNVSYKHIGQLLELAAYRDLYYFNKTKDNKLEKLLVLDILERLGDVSSNPLIKVDDKYIYFTCEHLR